MKGDHKHVTFRLQEKDSDKNNNMKNGRDKGKIKHRSKQFDAAKFKLSRENIPDGSDVFRQVLEEIESESNEEVVPYKSGNGQENRPLKSILKKK